MLMRTTDGQARSNDPCAIFIQANAIDRIVSPAMAEREKMREAMTRAGSFIADRQDLDIGAVCEANELLEGRRGFPAEIVALSNEEACGSEFLSNRVKLRR